MNATHTKSLLAHQWKGYPQFHRSPGNLLIHFVAVPAFIASNVVLIFALASGSWLAAAVSLAAMGGSVFAQGRGHRRESTPPELFTGPTNAIVRIFAEQWITFPRYVLSGDWFQALHASAER
ncbi:MAG TPA: terminase [Burkholderiaceae bacterium]|nr:terminase [Burkholderiaceae bacterium]